jgi:protein gp37
VVIGEFMATTTIEWTEASWNPVTGCTKISPGCKNCYAERMAIRLQAMGNKNYKNAFSLTLQPHMLNLPLSWKVPRQIFVNSMSDLFHEDVPLTYIQKVFGVMQQAKQHTFQVLTKRTQRLRTLSPEISWPDNVWMGVTVENYEVTSRIDDLRATDAKIKFLSCEPLLSSLDEINLTSIDWLIAGGESGPKSRPMCKDWVMELRDQCKQSDTAFFFKQWGGIHKKKTGRMLDGRLWNESPVQVPNFCTA